MEFTDLQLHQRILDAVKRVGYLSPSPIQEQAIPPALQGRDILGCAQTGTGKTAAFALPILQRLSDTDYPFTAARRKIRALILTPTRELALQIHESFVTYGRYLKIKTGIVMGGVSQYIQEQTLSRGVDILVATPGRLLDLVAQGVTALDGVEVLVLDEADRMLDMGFIHDVRKILKLVPQKKQTMLFTATMPPEVRELTETILDNPINIAVNPVSSTVDATTQLVYLTDKASKPDLLVWLLKNDPSMISSLIFTRTKHGADRLVKCLKKAEINSMAIHGDKSQGARQNALASFKNGLIGTLVATDIAARGIDIQDLSHVINYEFPNEPENYVHRIGRTGRAGKAGTAISLCDFDEKSYLVNAERLIKKKLTVVEEHPYPMTVFVKSPPKVRTPRPPRPQFMQKDTPKTGNNAAVLNKSSKPNNVPKPNNVSKSGNMSKPNNASKSGNATNRRDK